MTKKNLKIAIISLLCLNLYIFPTSAMEDPKNGSTEQIEKIEKNEIEEQEEIEENENKNNSFNSENNEDENNSKENENKDNSFNSENYYKKENFLENIFSSLLETSKERLLRESRDCMNILNNLSSYYEENLIDKEMSEKDINYLSIFVDTFNKNLERIKKDYEDYLDNFKSIPNNTLNDLDCYDISDNYKEFIDFYNNTSKRIFDSIKKHIEEIKNNKTLDKINTHLKNFNNLFYNNYYDLINIMSNNETFSKYDIEDIKERYGTLKETKNSLNLPRIKKEMKEIPIKTEKWKNVNDLISYTLTELNGIEKQFNSIPENIKKIEQAYNEFKTNVSKLKINTNLNSINFKKNNLSNVFNNRKSNFSNISYKEKKPYTYNINNISSGSEEDLGKNLKEIQNNANYINQQISKFQDEYIDLEEKLKDKNNIEHDDDKSRRELINLYSSITTFQETNQSSLRKYENSQLKDILHNINAILSGEKHDLKDIIKDEPYFSPDITHPIEYKNSKKDFNNKNNINNIFNHPQPNNSTINYKEKQSYNGNNISLKKNYGKNSYLDDIKNDIYLPENTPGCNNDQNIKNESKYYNAKSINQQISKFQDNLTNLKESIKNTNNLKNNKENLTNELFKLAEAIRNYKNESGKFLDNKQSFILDDMICEINMAINKLLI